MTAALLASRHTLDIDPVWVGTAAITGAVIGDTIGYTIGRRFGMSLFERLGKRFPKHFGPGHVALAKQLFARWGVWAVFFGRFVALLRILAGPLAGALRMRYGRFLAANASGAVCYRRHHRCRTTWVWPPRSGCRGSLGGIGDRDRRRDRNDVAAQERTRSAIAQLEAEHDWETLREHR